MDSTRPETIHYKRSRFSSRLPVSYLYSPAHYWMAEVEPGLYRVGFTKFATRMLGDIVEYGFEVKENDAVAVGQNIGWVEGFKALTETYSVMSGEFAGANPQIEEDITRIDADPYASGWLYAVRGTPDEKSVDVHGYVAILDATIARMLEKQGEG